MSLISIRFSIFLTEYDYQSYYAVSALLVSFKYEASTHNGVIQMFGKAFIKSKILDSQI